MKIIKTLFVISILFMISSNAYSLGVRIATKDDIKMLKSDFLAGRIKIGQTRLNKVRYTYGDPTDIKDTEKSITYNYGDVTLVFDKKRYWRTWKYDFSHKTAYTDEIDALRFDLEDKQVTGRFYSFDQLVKDYDVPTESYEKSGDGEISVYYWGELRLTFENYYVLKSVTGKNLKPAANEALSSGK